MKRTDEHRPSAIIPTDYLYVGVKYLGGNPEIEEAYRDSLLDVQSYQERNHLEVDLASKGTCICCGAHAKHVGVFHHIPSNKIVYFGRECATKVSLEDASLFASNVAHALEDAKNGWVKAGQSFGKFIGISDEEGSHLVAFAKRFNSFHHTQKSRDLFPEVCFNVRFPDLAGFMLEYEAPTSKEWTYHVEKRLSNAASLASMIHKFCMYGSLSERQCEFIFKLIDELRRPIGPKIRADEEKNSTRAKVKEGRYLIEGKIVTLKEYENDFGTGWKMLVESSDGSKYWGSVPSAIAADKGDEVEFIATVVRSSEDHFFGFYKRPSKAKNLTPKSDES